MKIYKGDGEGKNEEILANYFETGVTFALFQKDLWKVRRMLIALISKLSHDKAARRNVLAMVPRIRVRQTQLQHHGGQKQERGLWDAHE
eukprot:5974948-Amphidinium_carterae.1